MGKRAKWGLALGEALGLHHMLRRLQFPSAYRHPRASSVMSKSTWVADGLTQLDFMKLDECVVVSPQDIIIGSANKRDCHRFEKETPNGKLHRAFSVFLFDSKDRLLLQQRAKIKVSGDAMPCQ